MTNSSEIWHWGLESLILTRHTILLPYQFSGFQHVSSRYYQGYLSCHLCLSLGDTNKSEYNKKHKTGLASLT